MRKVNIEVDQCEQVYMNRNSGGQLQECHVTTHNGREMREDVRECYYLWFGGMFLYEGGRRGALQSIGSIATCHNSRGRHLTGLWDEWQGIQYCFCSCIDAAILMKHLYYKSILWGLTRPHLWIATVLGTVTGVKRAMFCFVSNRTWIEIMGFLCEWWFPVLLVPDLLSG